ncbi:TadE/TadG family type IV pilus assembly protein [Salibacterium halotolerans]|uniref:Putative Flp pilus-assembly TadE/G-like n=1 Tax=Salibacterium halotolerans TaxID=1884432 RepID=A0A1I5TRK1_9BACI|nr:pilus assembly protein TadG-related protein [Salibacterium halotolerans]SFP85694.1 Putative Flp pilus-assembly TadE/G-like [Salibacterium halotolerans]
MKHILKREEGFAVPFVAVMLPVFIALCGLLIDGGLMAANYMKLTGAVDAAAHAALDSYDKTAWEEDGTIDIQPAGARNLADDYLHANYPEARMEIFESDSTSVYVKASVSSPLFFMKVAGINEVSIEASSGASLGGG